MSLEISHDYRLATIASWRIIAELMRRHHKSGLQAMELHPGDGQYDCLGLIIGLHGREGRSLCHINRPGGLHIFDTWASPRRALNDPPWDRWADTTRLEYLTAWIAMADAKAFVFHLEDALGLPSTRQQTAPPTTPATLVFRLLAAWQSRFFAASDWLEIRSAWCDSSGMEGSSVREEIRQFPLAHAEIARREGWEQVEQAIQYWLLTRVSTDQTPELVGLIDLKGNLYLASSPTIPRDMYAPYQRHGRSLSALVAEMEHVLPVAFGARINPAH
jgi:hypothetical protein